MRPSSQLAYFGAIAAMMHPAAEPVRSRPGRLIKERGTSVTGSITKTEREIRNLKKKRAALDRKRNRKR